MWFSLSSYSFNSITEALNWSTTLPSWVAREQALGPVPPSTEDLLTGYFLMYSVKRFVKMALLDFSGPSLSINYIAINKDMEKRLPQIYHTKTKIYYEQSRVNIGVVTTTKWRHHLFYLQSYFSALVFFQQLLTGAFVPPIFASMLKAFSRFFRMTF